MSDDLVTLCCVAALQCTQSVDQRSIARTYLKLWRSIGVLVYWTSRNLVSQYKSIKNTPLLLIHLLYYTISPTCTKHNGLSFSLHCCCFCSDIVIVGVQVHTGRVVKSGSSWQGFLFIYFMQLATLWLDEPIAEGDFQSSTDSIGRHCTWWSTIWIPFPSSLPLPWQNLPPW